MVVSFSVHIIKRPMMLVCVLSGDAVFIIWWRGWHSGSSTAKLLSVPVSLKSRYLGKYSEIMQIPCFSSHFCPSLLVPVDGSSLWQWWLQRLPNQKWTLIISNPYLRPKDQNLLKWKIAVSCQMCLSHSCEIRHPVEVQQAYRTWILTPAPHQCRNQGSFSLSYVNTQHD